MKSIQNITTLLLTITLALLLSACNTKTSQDDNSTTDTSSPTTQTTGDTSATGSGGSSNATGGSNNTTSGTDNNATTGEGDDNTTTIPIDVTPPVVTLNGEANITLEQDAVYTELGATAVDDVDGNVSVNISGTVNTTVVGTYTLTYTAQDKAGNEANATRTVTVIDVTPPVITLNGQSNITLVQNTAYTELGATALDAVDGNVSVNISGTVDTGTIGNYTIVYTAQDNSGNEANTTRTITIIDVTPPVITLNGQSAISLEQNAGYTELGATALDAVDGNVSVTISGNVDTSTVGSYTVTYSATDSAGNEANITRAITVIDVTPPVITLNGAATITLEQNAPYTELGATALDAVDGNVSVNISGTVDTGTIGNYTVMYTAQDSAGNEENITRIITVIDVTPPVITLNGEANITLEQNAVYTELGATALDAVDGNVSVNITGTVDTSTIGEYILTYTATDSSGNSASVSRAVNVIKKPNQIKLLTLTALQTHFVRKKDTYTTGYYSNVDGEVKVIGTYFDGHSENVTDRVEWTSSMVSMSFDDHSFHAHVDGNATIGAFLDGISSNKITIYIEKEVDKDYAIEIRNNDKSNLGARGAKIVVSLLKKPTADVKLKIHIDPKEKLILGYTAVNHVKMYDQEIVFEEKMWKEPSISWEIDVTDLGTKSTAPYTIVTDNLISDDPYYDGMKIEDIVVKPLSKVELIEPSMRELRGAIRGVPIRFNVKSKQLGLIYTLIDPPRGMKIEKRMMQRGGHFGPMHVDMDGVDVLWEVPIDMEEKTYTITMKAKNDIGEETEISFPIKVPKTIPIQTEIINNELIVIDKNSLLYGMKMKGHNGEDISNLKLRSVDYEDVWKHNEIALDKNKKIEHIVFVVDNMPENLDIKFPEYMDTFEKRINLGTGFDQYMETSLASRQYWDWNNFDTDIYKYDNTDGVSLPHMYGNYRGESNGSKIFIFTLNEQL